MTTVRPVTKRSRWAIPKHAFYTAYHFALQYNDLRKEYQSNCELTSVVYDGMPKGNSLASTTEKMAIKNAQIKKKIDIIEQAAYEADPEISKWILYAVTTEGATFDYLYLARGIPCSRNTFYDRRRKFYYILDKKLKEM